MKRLVTLALCLLPSLALAIPPYPTVWYREQTVRNTADIRALEAATDALEESTVAHATDTDNPHGVTAGQIGALTAEEDAAALAAVAGVESNVTALAETVGGITAESLGALTAETDPAWTAASGSVVYATTPGYTAAVEQAASAYGWGDHSEAGYATTKAAGEIATNVVGSATNALLDLAGTRAMTGNLDMGGKSITNISTIGLPNGELSFSGNEVLYEGDSAWEYVTGTNVWLGRVNDTEASRIAALAEGAGGGNLIATNTPTAGQMLYASDATKTNLYFADAPSGTGTGWTNLSITGTGNAITGATAAADTLTLQRGEIEGGTGGTGTPLSSILVSADWTWTNTIYAVGADTSSTNVAITLPDAGTNFASVVIRKFSNLNNLTIMRGTNVVYTLDEDGSTRSYDWWPQRTNWYWRN